MNDDPIAFFITWTVYGTALQGDARGWKKRRKGIQVPEPKLERWHRDRLRHEVLLLPRESRADIEREIDRLAEYRSWRVWARSARSNHIHVAVTATCCSGDKVRDQLKANCTRVLRERWPAFRNRPVWTKGGDWQCINSEDDLAGVVEYVTECQNRKGLDSLSRKVS